jgi:hypothetical protein
MLFPKVLKLLTINENYAERIYKIICEKKSYKVNEIIRLLESNEYLISQI